MLDRAQTEERVLISADTDFGTILASSRAAGPSVIEVRRISRRRAQALAFLLLANVDDLAEHLGGREPRRSRGASGADPAAPHLTRATEAQAAARPRDNEKQRVTTRTVE